MPRGVPADVPRSRARPPASSASSPRPVRGAVPRARACRPPRARCPRPGTVPLDIPAVMAEQRAAARSGGPADDVILPTAMKNRRRSGHALHDRDRSPGALVTSGEKRVRPSAEPSAPQPNEAVVIRFKTKQTLDGVYRAEAEQKGCRTRGSGTRVAPAKGRDVRLRVRARVRGGAPAPTRPPSTSSRTSIARRRSTAAGSPRRRSALRG